jgi:glycosyltransferase involved in cell wall biosynthesis
LSDNRSIFVIIPCYNEARVIRKTVTEVLEKGYSVVVVDDCSKDRSKKQLTGLPIYYLRHRINMGQGAALQTGIDFARRKGAKYFVTFDADGQHDSNDIAGMVELIENEKVDVVFGSRFLPGSITNVSKSRSVVLNFGRYVNFLISGIMLSDSFNGFRLFSQNAAEKINLTENRMAHPAEFLALTATKKLKYTEYAVAIHYSDYSKAKGLKNKDGIKILFEILLYKIFR